MKPSQLNLENNKSQKHTKRQQKKILITLKLMKLEQQLIQQKWRPIYEVIYEAYTKYSKIFSDDFIKECKDNSNEAYDIPREVKNNMK